MFVFDLLDKWQLRFFRNESYKIVDIILEERLRNLKIEDIPLVFKASATSKIWMVG